MDKFLNRITYLDAIDGMKKLPCDSIDLICIDPPYEINYVEWDKQCLNWFDLSKCFLRLLKNTGNLIVFQGWSNVTKTISKLEQYFNLEDWIIYDRIKGRGAKRHLVSTREDILWFTISKNYTYNKIYSNIPKKTKGMGEKNGQQNRALSNVWTDISPIVPWSKERVNHPTQKPLQLIKRIITIFSNESDTILDCFSGSGTVASACKELNRNFICFDNNKDYVKISKERIKNG